MRLLPPDVTEALAGRVDKAVLRGFGLINNLAEADVAREAVRIGLPIADGGVGLRPLEWSRATAFVASWLQCAAGVADAVHEAVPAVRNWQGRALPSQQHVARAVQQLADEWHVDALQLAGASWADFANVARAKQQRVITRATVDVRRDRWAMTATLRDQQTAKSASSEGDRPGAGDWLIAAPKDKTLSISDEAYSH